MAVTGVAGAGVMGVGVAQNLATAGHEVILMDVDTGALDRARADITRNCRSSRLLGGPAVDPDAVLGAITFGVGAPALAKAELVIENIVEDWATKRTLYGEMDEICGPGTIFVANTSAIPITRIGAATRRPEKVIGVHFMNPVPHKAVVELIPGLLTSTDTIDRTRTLLAEMGKRPVEVKDSCGFVSNRVLMPTINEAAFLVHEGVASAAAVDEVFRGCFGHPMGPLETADLIGVDTILYSIEVLYEHFGDPKYRPCPLLKQMTDAGLHGRKTGQGFYPYSTPGR
ncbi:3-hydroxyacyl-CoA dehydrogenase NAD-binding domain-containing protein [Micromonospora sp. NPDC049044]|uniref:3-hydroxyacyl-CoA dehydrogenase family protein n=1 Tax=unclassified Micromonospora TaxID=2617518 RepID=UPI00340C46A5